MFRRLDVAMDQGRSGREASPSAWGDQLGDLHGPADGHHAALAQMRFECLPVDEFHHDIEVARPTSPQSKTRTTPGDWRARRQPAPSRRKTFGDAGASRQGGRAGNLIATSRSRVAVATTIGPRPFPPRRSARGVHTGRRRTIADTDRRDMPIPARLSVSSSARTRPPAEPRRGGGRRPIGARATKHHPLSHLPHSGPLARGLNELA
jgi:hypothetical protein